ncbi:MAG: hypothetical protein ABI454_07665 [Sphingomicrobium sp.]
MRRMIALVLACTLVGASSPDGPQRTAEAQAKLDKMLGGRMAGEAKRCVTSDVLTSPIGIDDQTLLFRDGPRVWRTELQSSIECGNIGPQSFIMTDSGANRVCSGQQLDFSDGGIRGACVLGEFVPYTKAK